MPGAIDQELLNGGLVTKRHPTMLNQGELQQTDDCVYRSFDPAIHGAPGRTTYNATALGSPSAVKGFGHLTFDGQKTDQLVAFAGTALYSGDFTGLTGSFAEMGGPGQVAGTISGTATFVATTGFPFLATAVGCSVRGVGVPIGTIVSTVTNQSGTTGHYNTVTLSLASSNGATTLAFDFGTVLALSDVGTEVFDVVQWNNAYYSWFGKGTPQRIAFRNRPSLPAGGGALTDILAMRPVSLGPVVTAPTIAQVTAAGWNVTLGVGYYWFLITEIYAPGGDVTAAEKNPNLAPEVVESAYMAPDPSATDPSSSTGRPIAKQITNTATQGIQITFPDVVNTGVDTRLASNWGVYMYGPTSDDRTVPSLALFRRIATPAMTQFTSGQTITLQDAVQTQLGLPTVVAAGDGATIFTNSNALITGTTLDAARAKSGPSTDGAEVSTPAAVAVSSFGFDVSAPWSTRTIVGMEVYVKGAADPSGNAGTVAGYYFHVDTAAKHSGSYTGEFRSQTSVLVSHGGPQDTLAVGWVTSDLSTISVTLGKVGTGSRQRLIVNQVYLKVYFTGATINLNGPAYRVVSYRDQIGTTINDPANLPIPACSTGDVWNGSLVVNDLGLDSAIRYSLPGKPEAFPKPYVLKFGSRKNDKVTFIRVLNQMLVVGLRESIKRVNYLPTELDVDFQNNVIAHENLATEHGIVGSRAGTLLDMPNVGSILAYVSNKGIHFTDGITTKFLNIDLDWATTVDLAHIETCVLRAYPQENWLVLFYAPYGTSHGKNTRALIFPYAPDKVKPGGFLPAVGPIKVSGRSAEVATLSGRSYLLTGHESLGKIYVEDQAYALPSAYTVADSAGSETAITIIPAITTRRAHIVGRQKREQRVYLMTDAHGASVTVTSTLTIDSPAVTSAAGFGSIVVGMYLTPGNGIQPDTVVTAVTNTSNITISKVPTVTGSASLTFSTGTLGITVAGQDIGETLTTLSSGYQSTQTGGLMVSHVDSLKESLEYRFTKGAALGVGLRIHFFSIMDNDSSQETHRGS